MSVEPLNEEEWFDEIVESVERETENWSESLKQQLFLLETVS